MATNLIDLTEKFHNLSQQMQQSNITTISENNFSLYDSMQAGELCEAKTDLKILLKDNNYSVKGFIDRKLIKDPSELTIEEINGIFDLMLTKEMMWFQGQAIQQTIYTFIYQYDVEIGNKNEFIKGWIDSQQVIGSVCYELLLHCYYLRDDEFTPSLVGFYKIEDKDQAIDNAVKQLVELETGIKNQCNLSKKVNKKKKNQIKINSFDLLDARLKLRRMLLQIYKIIINKFHPSQIDQMYELINGAQKKITFIEENLNECTANCESFFNNDIIATLLCHIPPRKVPTITVQQAYTNQQTMLQKLKTVMKIAQLTDFYEIASEVQQFVQNEDQNMITRAYLEQNIINRQNNQFFNSLQFSDIMKDVFNQMGINCEKIAMDEAFKDFMPKAEIMGIEWICKFLRNKYKIRRDLTKFYTDLSILVSESNSTDEALFKQKGLSNIFLIWSFDMGIKAMTYQLNLGFEQELYSYSDYPIIYFWLDYLYSIMETNHKNYCSKFNKHFITAWESNQKIQVEKQKKKLTPFQRMFFFESLFYKAVQNLNKFLKYFTYLLTVKKLFRQIDDHSTLQLRYEHRIKIFSQVYFVKKFEFEEYQDQMNKSLFENEMELKPLLDEAQKQFKLLSMETNIPEYIIKESSKLSKICILNSLGLATYSKNKNLSPQELNIVLSNKEHPIYQYIVVTVNKK